MSGFLSAGLRHHSRWARSPALADICIVGQVVGAHFLKLPLSAFPSVTGLVERCFALPAFASSHPFEQPGYKTAKATH
jgi:glutathione S-transferase